MKNELDLVLERVVDVSPELVFKAWTTPKHLMPWFCPKPYRTVECEIDLRPGGKFFAQMEDADGNRLPAAPGCYLEIVTNRRLVWTSALGPGFRPQEASPAPWGFFTAVLTFEPHGNGGCRYTATALHAAKAQAGAHEKMGFTQGWGKALEQLVEYVKTTRMS